MMTTKAVTILGCAAAALTCWVAPTALAADEAAAAEPQVDEELEAEIAYVEALIEYGFPDFANPVIAATKQKWPESEVRFFAFEIRSMLMLGKYDEAEKKIASLPDRKGSKFWAARLELANNYAARGKKKECSAIYQEFFSTFPTPPKELRKFCLEARYAWGQILQGDKRLKEAADNNRKLIEQLGKPVTGEDWNIWCNVMAETADIYLRLASDVAPKARGDLLKSAKEIVDKLLWHREMRLYYGRAIAMKAHIELLKGDVAKAQTTIDDYMDQLADIHEQLLRADPDGRGGQLKQSPMPLCRYMLAVMLWDEAQAELKKPKRDDEKVKSLMFGEKKGAKRNNQGAYNHALNVFVKYPESPWAGKAGQLADAIEDCATKTYGAKIKKQVTPEQLAKIRQMQFRDADALRAEGNVEEAIKAYYEALAQYPECLEAIGAIESLVGSYQSLIAHADDKARAEGWRLEADAVSGYLAERFAGHRDRALMSAAGEAVQRLAAAEKQRGQLARANRLYDEFITNYRRHVNASPMAASLAGEAQAAGRWADAARTWEIIGKYYTNSTYYASSLAQLSYCYQKLGNYDASTEALKRYLAVETDAVKRDTAQMQLAQRYKNEGFDILAGAETNETEEAVSKALTEGSKSVIHGIKEFRDIAAKAAKAAADPGLRPADKAKYNELREGALFLVGDCWGRLSKPAEKIEAFRKNAAQSYEEYLVAYPEGKYSTNAYVRLGTIYTALGDVDRSRDALDRLSKKFPDSYEAKNSKPRLAKSLIEMGMKKEGTDLYAEMLKTDGAYTAVQFLNAGEALVEARSWNLAGQAFDLAIAKAATNQSYVVARARIGGAKSLFAQKKYVEARDAIDQFASDAKMKSSPLQADAQFMLIEVMSEIGRTEKDADLRRKDFGVAIQAIKKVRSYWAKKPRDEQNRLGLMSADISIRKMNAEEAMGLKDEAAETRGKAAAALRSYLQVNGVSESTPLDGFSPLDLENLEGAYARLVPLLAAMGAEQAADAMRFGNEYLEYFPQGKERQTVLNAMNLARAEAGAAAATPAEEPAATTTSEGEKTNE